MTTNALYFILKAFIVIKIFTCFVKWLYKKAEANFKNYDVTDWNTKNYI